MAAYDETKPETAAKGSDSKGESDKAKLRRELEQRWTSMTAARSSVLADWREISYHMRPDAFRDTAEKRDQHNDDFLDIINSTPLDAAATLASGMMEGITSPARPWFHFTLSDQELKEEPEVKWWLSSVERIVRESMEKSNIYRAFHSAYEDLGPFGTAALWLEEDDADDVRAYNFPVGSYCLAASARGDIDTVYREVPMTVAELVAFAGKDGLSKLSQATRTMWEAKSQLDTVVVVMHAVYPNSDYEAGVIGPKGKRWSSKWWERNSNAAEGFFRESGFETFNLAGPRWKKLGTDTYGSGPGKQALGDCKALQLLERRSAQAADKHVNPPMSAPTTARYSPISLLPNEVSFVDALGAGQALRPAVTIDPRAVEIIEAKIQRHEQRIKRAFHADLWLMLAQYDGPQMTAEEVRERRSEKLLQLGTVLESLQNELLEPVVLFFFRVLFERGKLPPPPKVLQGRNFDIEYISMMASAQKLLATTGLERLANVVGNLSKVKPNVIDKVDWDQIVDEYSDALGTPAAVVRTDKQVKKVRKERAAAEQQQAQLAAAQQGADVAKTLADSSLENPNALKAMLGAAGVA